MEEKENVFNFFEKNPFKNISLSDQCIQTIPGGILGDGSLKIQKNYANARFQIRHSITQKEYLLWKAKNLKEIGLSTLKIQKADGFSKNKKIGFQSKAMLQLTQIHSICCPNNSLKVQEHWLKAIDKLALLVWWLDDGSLISNGKRGCFCTHALTYEEHKLLQHYFQEKWGIKTTIGNIFSKKSKTSNFDVTDFNYFDEENILDVDGIKQTQKPKYYTLNLANTELRKLFDLIMPLMETESLVQKFAFKYKDLNYQQRWLSTMKEAMPQFSKEIDRLYSGNDVS